MTIDEKYENLSFSFRALAKSAGKLAEENEALKKKNSELELLKVEVEALKRENMEIRKFAWRLRQTEIDLQEKVDFYEYLINDMKSICEWWDENERKK